MKAWHITDTHGQHESLTLPDNIDIIIHTGDCSNTKNPTKNYKEVMDFINWYGNLPGIKLFVPGNHDTSIEHNLVLREDFAAAGINLLINQTIELFGINFYGSPYTPTFGSNWSYNKSRNTIGRLWENIPLDTHIILTHGPPKGILDITEDFNRNLEFCGDGALLKRILKLPNITHHLFGHIHSYKNCINHGTRSYNNILFSNACVLEDTRFEYGIIYNGNIIEL